MTPNPFDPGYYDEHELSQFGFGCVGHNVRIAKNCTLINLGKIMIGSNVRIDGYTTIVAGPASVEIKQSFITHIGSSVLIIGGAGVVVGDFCMLSHGARIFTRSDDYSGGAFTNPTVPKMYTNVRVAAVEVRKHAASGAGSRHFARRNTRGGDGCWCLVARSKIHGTMDHLRRKPRGQNRDEKENRPRC